MNTKELFEKTNSLKQLASKLFYPAEEDDLMYLDTFCQMKLEALRQSDRLFRLKGKTIEEEAELCVALLMGYNASILREDAKIQAILDRAYVILEKLPPSLVKCQLLTYCYAEIYEPDMAREAHAIIDTWIGRELSVEERNIKMDLEAIEDNQPPIEYPD